MFRQWEAKQDVKKADWLIGRDIMGPAAKKKGVACLRDMADPAAKHCLAPQPNKHLASVEELGALTVFLASEAAASITGIALPVDGGWTAH